MDQNYIEVCGSKFHWDGCTGHADASALGIAPGQKMPTVVIVHSHKTGSSLAFIPSHSLRNLGNNGEIVGWSYICEGDVNTYGLTILND